MDADNDGFISKEEFCAATLDTSQWLESHGRYDPRRSHWDVSDKDWAKHLVAKADANGDGKISVREMTDLYMKKLGDAPTDDWNIYIKNLGAGILLPDEAAAVEALVQSKLMADLQGVVDRNTQLAAR